MTLKMWKERALFRPPVCWYSSRACSTGSNKWIDRYIYIFKLKTRHDANRCSCVCGVLCLVHSNNNRKTQWIKLSAYTSICCHAFERKISCVLFLAFWLSFVWFNLLTDALLMAVIIAKRREYTNNQCMRITLSPLMSWFGCVTLKNRSNERFNPLADGIFSNMAFSFFLYWLNRFYSWMHDEYSTIAMAFHGLVLLVQYMHLSV